MWTREKLEKLSTHRLHNLFKQYRGYALTPLDDDDSCRGGMRDEIDASLDLMKEILDKREHIPRKERKRQQQGKRKRGTKNARR